MTTTLRIKNPQFKPSLKKPTKAQTEAARQRLAQSTMTRADRLQLAALKKMEAGFPMQVEVQRSQISRTGSESNFVDLASASYICDTTGTITLVATIAQGASVNQRIGKKAFYKSFTIRGRWIAGTTTTTANGTVMLVYDKKPTGALPAITDIVTGINATAFNNDNNTSRFRIIRRRDEIFLGNVATPTTGKEGVCISDFISFKERIEFESAGTGAMGDIDTGAVYLVTFGNTTTTSAPVYTVAIRTRFSD